MSITASGQIDAKDCCKLPLVTVDDSTDGLCRLYRREASAFSGIGGTFAKIYVPDEGSRVQAEAQSAPKVHVAV